MKIYFSFLFIFIFISCNSKNTKNDLNTTDLRPLEPNKNLQYVKEITDFDDLFVLKDSIQLETSPECLMDFPWTALFSGGNILLTDIISAKSIFEFGNDGKYKGKIGRFGEGPGEYRSPELSAVIDNELFVYDPPLLRVSVFNIYNRKFIRSWNIKKFYFSVAEINGNLAFLNRFGQGYADDYEIYNPLGEKVSSGSFAKSESEDKRAYMFGGSFLISRLKNHLIYLGADEYKIICHDLDSEKDIWISQEIPDVLKVPKELPKNVAELGYRWMSKNYSSLLGFFSFNNGLIIVVADDYLLLYDNNGNFLKYIKNPNRKNYFTTDGKYLYEVSHPHEDKNGNLLNPFVKTYEFKNAI